MLSMIIKKSRPNLSDVSINQYLSSLRTLNGGQPINDLNFLNDFDAVMLSLKKKKPTTVKNYANAAVRLDAGGTSRGRFTAATRGSSKQAGIQLYPQTRCTRHEAKF